MSRLNDICLDLAWSQWTALGVRGVAKPPDDAIDLEALILFTATLRDADPRLFEESLDWCVRCASNTISLSRLRRLHGRLPDDQKAQFQDLAHAIQQHTPINLPGAPFVQRPKTTPHRLSGKSRLPSPLTHPSLIQRRARHAIGVTARVEIFISLVMEREDAAPSAADLAHLGYAKQSLVEILDGLVDAEIVERLQRGNQHRYRLVRRNELRALLAPLPRSAPPWTLRLPILAALRSTIERVEKKAAIVQDVELAKELQRNMHGFRALGYPDAGIPTQGHTSRQLEEWAITLTGATPGYPRD